MFSDLHYAYLVGDLFLFLIWLIFFLARKDLRKEMLLISILSIPFGLTQYFFAADYWQPQHLVGNVFLGFEDFFYMFATGGITGVIYEEFFGKRLSKHRGKSHTYMMLLFVIFGISALFIGTKVFHINSIYVASMTFLAISIVTLSIRHDLLKHAFYSAISLACLTLVFDIFYVFLFPSVFREWWMLDHVSGVLIFGVPFEELLFAFMFGFLAGPMYEFVFGLKLKK